LSQRWGPTFTLPRLCAVLSSREWIKPQCYVDFLLSAKLEGVHFFDKVPGLCRTIGSLCTISCVTSLMTISAMSCNRYVYIVHNSRYTTIFRARNCVIYCVSFYCVGLCLVLLNLADIGDHSFDHKSLECIWDRMATYTYTIVFSVVLVWIPIIVTGCSYLHMYVHVQGVRNRVHNVNGNATGRSTGFKLAKTLFIIYCVFSTCWIPYALLIVADSQDTFSYELHVLIVVFAHLHPSINWLVYYVTNRKFHVAFKYLLRLNRSLPVGSQTAAVSVISSQLERRDAGTNEKGRGRCSLDGKGTM